jgi:hypothetical protein
MFITNLTNSQLKTMARQAFAEKNKHTIVTTNPNRVNNQGISHEKPSERFIVIKETKVRVGAKGKPIYPRETHKKSSLIQD